MRANKRCFGLLMSLMLSAPLWGLADNPIQLSVRIPGQITTTQAATFLTVIQNLLTPRGITVTGQKTTDALVLKLSKRGTGYQIYWQKSSLASCRPNQSPQAIQGETFSVSCDQGDHRTYILNTIILLLPDAKNPTPRITVTNDRGTTTYKCSRGISNCGLGGLTTPCNPSNQFFGIPDTRGLYWISAANSFGYLTPSVLTGACNFPK